MRSLVLLLVALLALAGCSAPAGELELEHDAGGAEELGGLPLHSTLAVDPAAFDVETRRALVRAFEQWEASTGSVELNLRSTATPAPGEPTIRTGVGAGARAGEWERASLTVWVDLEQLNGNALTIEAVIVHELGHAFGVGHTATGIMAEKYSSGRPCIDAAALELFCTLNDCATFAPTC